MTEIIVALIAFGAGMGVEWMRTRGRIAEQGTSLDRKDHEHRQDYYHQLVDRADDLIWELEQAPSPEPPGSTMGDAEEWMIETEHHEAEQRRHLGMYRSILSAIETFGSEAVMQAGREFARAAEEGADIDDLRQKREALIVAARADVGAPK